jgi:hypothetical protein
MQPNVQQEKAQTDEHKAQSWVLGGRPSPNLAGAAVAGFHAESTTIRTTRLARRQVQVDHDEQQPAGASFHPSCPLGCGEDSTDSYLGRELLFLCGIAEGMCRTVAVVTLTQGSSAARAATDRTGDESGYAALIEIGLAVNTGKAFVQEQAVYTYSNLKTLARVFQHLIGRQLWCIIHPGLALLELFVRNLQFTRIGQAHQLLCP